MWSKTKKINWESEKLRKFTNIETLEDSVHKTKDYFI